MDKNKNYKNNNKNKTFKRKSNLKEIKQTNLHNNLTINGTKYVGDYAFACGNNVPIYEVSTIHALNQLIGHAKFNNSNYGNVYYRGECKLHESLRPSLFRNVVNIEKSSERLKKLIDKIIDDPHMKKNLKVDLVDRKTSEYKVEGMLQHYGVPTRFIDVVDNHWVALWMGLNRSTKIKSFKEYYHYTERSIPLVEIATENDFDNDTLFQYILLLAIPFSTNKKLTAFQSSKNYIEIDLRQALPSTFLRPHAQHGLVVRRKVHPDNPHTPDSYDMAQSVVGIIKVRIDKVKDWVGNGELLTQNNLFPSAAYDIGYDVLLSRDDLFEGSGFSIVKYV